MLVVVSHDAGGAELISSFVRQQHLECIYVLDGPARKIFQRKVGHVESMPLDKALALASEVITGTSWQSDLEYYAICKARMLGIRSIAFLDHWVNYRERFSRDGKVCLPDEIWVGDEDAEVLAKKCFPNSSVKLVANPYFQDIRSELLNSETVDKSAKRGISVLFVGEPVREHARLRYGDERHWGYVEEDALRYLLENIDVLGAVDYVRIRPHPSESSKNYSWVRGEFSLPIEIVGSRTLLEEIAESDVVAGMQSMAMVVGLLANKRVVSCIPPGGQPCVLPHRGIAKLIDVVKSVRPL